MRNFLQQFKRGRRLAQIKKTNQRKRALPPLVAEVMEYWAFLRRYVQFRLARIFYKFESLKDALVDTLYRRRGKYARPFVHTGMMGLLIIMVALGPMVLEADVFSQDFSQGTLPSAVVLGATTVDTTYAVDTVTGVEVEKYRGGEVLEYVVQEGDTISTIGDKFEISQETILWANNMEEKDTIKPGQKLRILPVTGIEHVVRKGETIYSVAKKYGLDGDSGAQVIVDYPFNEFVNDEKFTLAVGQKLVVPGGAKQDEKKPISTIARVSTPDAGVVSATGAFVWPASGRITQGYSFYHKAIDIANKSGGPILAADAGIVIEAGWPDNYGYGNRVMIDHRNGYVTLYAHLSRIRVSVGQGVNRGDIVGDMGSTGRSTGTHLHFEIRRKGGGLENPLIFLK